MDRVRGRRRRTATAPRPRQHRHVHRRRPAARRRPFARTRAPTIRSRDPTLADLVGLDTKSRSSRPTPDRPLRHRHTRHVPRRRAHRRAANQGALRLADGTPDTLEASLLIRQRVDLAHQLGHDLQRSPRPLTLGAQRRTCPDANNRSLRPSLTEPGDQACLLPRPCGRPAQYSRRARSGRCPSVTVEDRNALARGGASGSVRRADLQTRSSSL